MIGGSNLGRIAKAAAKNGHMVVDLTVNGRVPKSGKIEKLCDTLKKLNLTEKDTVVIDPMSNSAYQSGPQTGGGGGQGPRGGYTPYRSAGPPPARGGTSGGHQGRWGRPACIQ